MFNTVIIQADASRKIGIGHMMRCLALAQAWQDAGGRVIFITACENGTLLKLLSAEGIEVIAVKRPYPDIANRKITTNVLAKKPEAWVVLDGYHFTTDYQKKIKEAGHKLLVIDDMAHLEYYWADLVLNQNLGAENLSYPCEPYALCLLGLRYAMLRREFWTQHSQQRRQGEKDVNVIVTLGGADPDNVTLKVIRAIEQVKTPLVKIKIIVGPDNPNIEILRKEIKKIKKGSIIEIQLIEGADMAKMMVWSDIAICAGGSVCWELAHFGVPTILLVLAENQRRVADGIHEIGAGSNLGWHRDVTATRIAREVERLANDSDLRLKISGRMKALVDGRGQNRVVQAMANASLMLRAVTADDCELLWQWVNDPEVRSSALQSQHISWEEHIRWFKVKLKDPNCFHFIALDGMYQPVGQVRFDIGDECAEIDISVASQYRNRKLGTYMLRLACFELFRQTKVRRCYAIVKAENIVSIRMFEAAGFTRERTIIAHDIECVSLFLATPATAGSPSSYF